MSHKHLHLLQAIYRDPPSANIHWREIESLLGHLGATVESGHGARFRVVLNRFEIFLHQPHNNATCARQDIKVLREFLARAGVTLSRYEESQKDSRRRAASGSASRAPGCVANPITAAPAPPRPGC